MSVNNLSGKNIVIIGGTAGIGLATAVAASDLGAKVWAAGRSQAHIEKAKEVGGGKFEVRQADTHNSEDLQAIFQEVGSIDHLVSAAVGGERTLKPWRTVCSRQALLPTQLYAPMCKMPLSR